MLQLTPFYTFLIVNAFFIYIGLFTPSSEFSIDGRTLILRRRFIWGERVTEMKSADVQEINVILTGSDQDRWYYLSILFRNGLRYDSAEFKSKQDVLDLSSRVHAALPPSYPQARTARGWRSE